MHQVWSPYYGAGILCETCVDVGRIETPGPPCESGTTVLEGAAVGAISYSITAPELTCNQFKNPLTGQSVNESSGDQLTRRCQSAGTALAKLKLWRRAGADVCPAPLPKLPHYALLVRRHIKTVDIGARVSVYGDTHRRFERQLDLQ